MHDRMPHPTCPWKRGFGLFGYGLTSIATTRNKRQLAKFKKPGLTKDAYHTIFIWKKCLSYSFIPFHRVKVYALK